MVEAFFAPIFFVIVVVVIGIAVAVARIRRRRAALRRESDDAARPDMETQRRRRTG